MAGYWPTPDAVKTDPVIAGVMNNSPKIVFSKTMKPVKDGPVWKNVTVLQEIDPEEIRGMKKKAGGDMVILGSGLIVQQLSNFGLIDEYQLMVHPVVLGAGKYLFSGVNRMNLKLNELRTFESGKVFLNTALSEKLSREMILNPALRKNSVESVIALFQKENNAAGSV